jgi:YidC/Oxa1 family membrane protein insertase
MKSKYFLATVLTVDPDQPRLGGAVVVGGQRSGKNATHATATVSLPAPGGRFAFSTYVGPQDYKRLSRMGHGLEDVNSYGWIFRPIIQPFANFIVVVLLWMHENLNMAYGWVLILFGLAVRVVLWPLNQKAMRSSMAMQAVQPELKAVQERYKQDPQKMQQEVMKLYKEHGVNPLGGCLPMLIPMPVLFALFFVFRVTIEFRGVPFLWLPDLSRADPYFIIPVVMGLSMFAVSKIGQIGVPPNPQAKMMLYIMPVFLTFIFLKLSSGLNLYYAVSNIASVPQQWMIAQQRLRKLGKRE